jgi:outer membrane protein assembly factor BamB
MQTPLVYGEQLYCCSDAGVLTCYDADTGVVRYRQRLGGGGSGFSASAVATDGKLYLTSEEGEVHVVAAGPEFERLAVNDMGETCMATPAISEGVLFWRTRGHVVAVAER